MESNKPSTNSTVIAMAILGALTWAVTFVFFMSLDAYRKDQIEGVRKDVKGINQQLEVAAERQEIIRSDVEDVHEFLQVPE